MEDELKLFYQNNLSQYGHSARGVGWKNQQAQEVRFEQLLKVIRLPDCSINDLGCGTGDFIGFAQDRISGCTYRGYDVMEDMVSMAKKKYGSFDNASFYLIKQSAEMQTAQYTIASGIFNIRFQTDNDSWLAYILDTLRIMDARSTAGFAFNILTKYSDAEFMKPELYYADPGFLFDFCKRTFSKNVALLHDYDQYDFTLIVRKENKI
jgi:SAM-dependent methyltransferase